jgi:hypothetical protein
MTKHFYITILLLLVSCSTGPKPAPNWVDIQPVSTDRWYGIGISLITNKSDYREVARNKATEEIGAQITIHLESSFELVQKEINLNYEEYSKSVINTRVDISMPEVKIVDTYTDGIRYYIMAQLIKDDYNRIIRLKKQKAVETALDYMTSAEQNLSIESFNYLNKALKEITPFIDFPLKAEYPKDSRKQVSLYSTIHILKQNLNNRFVLISNKDVLFTTIGIRKEHVFTVSCTDKLTGSYLSGIPLKASMPGNQITENMVTDKNGKTGFHLFKVMNKTPVQYIDIGLDIAGSSNGNQVSSTSIQVKVNAESPSLFVDIREKNLNKRTQNPFITPALKEFFVSTYGAEFVESKHQSDYRISANINTLSKGKTIIGDIDLFTTYADGTISIFDTKTEKELYQKSINNVRGVSFTSFEDAGRDALKKMVKKLDENIFQEIILGLDSN